MSPAMRAVAWCWKISCGVRAMSPPGPGHPGGALVVRRGPAWCLSVLRGTCRRSPIRPAPGVFLPLAGVGRTPGAREEPLEREGAVAHDGAVVPAPVLVRLTGPLRVERDG